ncbi:uncharacterized protein LOC120780851 [Bactrocera tryoni]|uniref:uncharacterized protein LOC120780851 n=1 Tax=Bactrocera tryoni TaxID=59916 RepID=UPI001A975F2E|nr:uncharacterized protein LOC120780851 [Bactrocera tryoni]
MNTDAIDADAVLKMTVVTLKEKLRSLGLGIVGRKHELRERLLRHLGLIDDGDDDDDDDDGFQSNKSAIESPARSSATLVRTAHFTFKDIQESLSTFDGNDTSDVEKWIEQIEENAEIVNWNEVHKFIYAKQLLRGAAKLFVSSQTGLRNWNSLTSALIKEFGNKLSAADVHKVLGKRFKKPGESYREYLYALMEIGKSVRLDEGSLLEYFVDGIPGSKFSKATLYQAKTIIELKEQIVTYEKITRDSRDNHKKVEIHNRAKQENINSSLPARVEKRCFKCGEFSHVAKECKHKQFKCFKCQQMGHRSFECKAQQGASTKREQGHVNSIGEVSKANLKLKQIKICNVDAWALIDTGCSLCLMRCDTFSKLDKSIKLTPEQRQLFGIGAAKISTMGSFEAMVLIDNSPVNLTFHVVETGDISYEVILGNSILKHFDMMVRDDGVEFKRRVITQSSYKSDGAKNDVSKDDDPMTNIFLNKCFNIDFKETDYDLSHLKNQLASTVRQMIEQYEPKKDDNPLVNMKIVLTDEVPVYQPPRRVSYEEQKVIEKQVEQWLDEGIIRPSCSSYASPVVLVSKKNGTKRLCCDYRKLNSKIIRDNFPMTLIDDALEKLREANVYTTLDLAKGFFHVPVDANSRKYTAFVTHSGQYEFQYVPFGCDMRISESAPLTEIIENEAIESFESDRNEAPQLAKQNISAIQEENRRSYNRKRHWAI